MNIQPFITAIDQQIVKLQQARALLIGLESTLVSVPVKRGSGKPTHPVVKQLATAKPKRRTLSPEARARIATAQKKRWAAAKKTPVKAAKA
jgi:hypothetical protein